MVGIFAAQVIDMQRHAGMIDQAVEKLGDEIDVKLPDDRTGKFAMELKPGTTGEIDDNTRQGFVERHVAMAVTSQAFFVAPGLGQRLAKGDADIFNRVVCIDMQVANGLNVQIDQTMTSDLIQHVIEKRDAGGKFSLPGAIKVETNSNLRFERIACNFGLPHG